MRIIILLGTFVLMIHACTAERYSAKQGYQRLKADQTQLYHSPHFGTIEYQIHEGRGIPVLVIHGLMGGYDQGMQTGRTLLPGNQAFLSISRFGYLRSDVPAQPTPKNQCFAYQEVLDQHNLDQVLLLATSAGGGIAFQFALLFPERVAGIILVGSGYPAQETEIEKGPPGFIYRDWIFQFMLNHMQGTLRKMFGISKEEYARADSFEQQLLSTVFRGLLPVNPRRAGILNDTEVTNRDLTTHAAAYPLEEISAPFLVLHARDDPMAKSQIMENAVQRLSSVKKIVYEDGGHLLFGHQKENKKYINKFIQKYSQLTEE